MQAAPLVSILTPWYNHARYAREYFDGLLAQTYRNLEILILDDGSTDESPVVLQQWARQLSKVFPRVIVRRQANMGGPGTLEQLYAAATGKYLCVLESDDYYLPDKIAANVDHLERHPEVGVVHSAAETVQGGKVLVASGPVPGWPIPSGDVFLELLAQHNFLFTCTVCMRSELAKQYISPMRYAALGYLMGDYPSWLDLALHTRFAYLPTPLARYRVLPESASHSKSTQYMFSFKKSYHQIRLDYLERYLDRVRADPVAYDRLRDQFALTVYWLREAWDYAGALQFLMQMLRIWGYRRTVLAPVAKLFPHLLVSLATRRPLEYKGFNAFC